ncbi:MAG: hypothetical protein FJ225_11240 [Lentisphaerae bacterium]|nr:hypothetical protein [Lentisphaerota bacterium]
MRKSRASWMRRGKFGVMVHWCVPKTPPQFGKRITDINKATDRFDLDRFIKDFRRTKADWLIFTIGQLTGFASPNSAMDRLVGPGHCTRRDLVLEVAQAVKRLGKRFIAYMPTMLSGKKFPCGPVRLSEREFHRQFSAVIEEYALRFGRNLDGWWFDGGSVDPEFHGALVSRLRAARAGNPAAAVTFNNGSLCLGFSQPLIPDQDYLSGESEFLLKGKIRYGRGTDVLTLLPAGASRKPAMGRAVTDCIGYVSTFPLPPPPATCLWHALIPIDAMWEHRIPFNYDWQKSPFPWVAPKPHQMEKPLYTVADLETVVREFKAVGGGVTFNAGIFQEGGLGPDTVSRLAQLAARLR